jgi:ABC-2 type transport system permease protein
MRRAVARKKVLTLVALTILIGTAPYYLLEVVHTSLITPPLKPYMWIIGVFLPQAFFVQFTALLIAAGSMSEEYESGTAEVLLSKPVSRDEYFFGKYLGGYCLLFGILVLDATLTVTSATFVFGPQVDLGILPMIVVSQVLAASVFYSVAFMLGELVRRSSLSYIIAASVFFTSEIIGGILDFLYDLTGSGIYVTANRYLPTSPVDSLPLLLAEPRIPGTASEIFKLGPLATPVETSVLASALLIVAYAVTAVLIALTYFGRTDVAKRVT